MSKYNKMTDAALWGACVVESESQATDIETLCIDLLTEWDGTWQMGRTADKKSYWCELFLSDSTFPATSTSIPRAVCIAWLMAKDAEKK